LQFGRSGEIYNVSRGAGIALKQLAEELLALGKVSATIVTEETRQRAQDIPVMVGDNRKIRRETKWEPKIDYSLMLKRLYDAAG